MISVTSATTAGKVACRIVAVWLLLQGSAFAESILNFVAGGRGHLVITNTSDVIADVEFTLYDRAGNVAAGIPNPLRHRVAPRKQLVLNSQDIFAIGSPQLQGWIQARSLVDGLQAAFLTGDLLRSYEAVGSPTPFTDQTVAYALPGTTVVLTNPEGSTVEASVRFYSRAGVLLATSYQTLRPHAQGIAFAPDNAASARVSSSAAILATGIHQTSDSLKVIEGQNAKAAPSAPQVLPYFQTPASKLVLTNPSATTAAVDATFFMDTFGQGITQTIHVPSNGTVIADWSIAAIGWVRLTPVSGASVNSLAVIEEGRSTTAFPPQAQRDRMVFPWTDGEGFPQRLSLIVDTNSVVVFHLLRADGTTAAEQQVGLSAGVRRTIALSELFPEAAKMHGGYVLASPSSPMYAVDVVYDPVRDLSSVIPIHAVSRQFVAASVTVPPVLVALDSATEVSPGVMRLRMATANDGGDTALVIGRQVYPMLPERTPDGVRLYADIPMPEPGFLTIRLRSAGVDSEPISVEIRNRAIGPATTLRGRAYYQKIPVTDDGLDLGRPLMVPIRNARVEVVDSATSQLLSVSETDEQGGFQVLAPDVPGLTVRVLSRVRRQNVSVLDNTNGNRAYAISVRVDMRDPDVALSPLQLIDRSRISGAFNILDILQLANDVILQAVPALVPPDLSVFWSERNTGRSGNPSQGLVGNSHFDVETGAAYIVGDRASDSDEFDDSVLLHEYAHFLAARFSRDDSPGGPHGLGDLLDPRLAWSEGWANFFSAAILQNPIYRDSRGSGTALGLRYDLEENVPLGDRPGYRSEASIQSLLWDLIDDGADAGDSARFSFPSLWAVFMDMHEDRFVYLPSFLERFRARNPEFADELRVMAQLRGIDFQPYAIPNISNPFPKLIQIGETVDGEVDSLTARRSNLAQSAHFYAFTIYEPSNVSIALQLRGLGPGNNPGFNDLDLFLLDANGVRLHQSHRGLNGQSEVIPSVQLPAGTYVIEIRSFYTSAETNSAVYNSGGYRLQVQTR
jgi:hypothetical protein